MKLRRRPWKACNGPRSPPRSLAGPERLDPAHPDTTGLLASALKRGARYSALEKLLWKTLAEHANPSAPDCERTFTDLVALYEGPLQRLETAQVLKRFRAAALAAQAD